jgi:hypothetical protein
MNGFEYFSYSTEQWDRIAASVAEMRGVDDANLIRRGGASLRDLIEVEAGVYCAQGLLNRRAADRQALIDNWIALRDDLRDRLVPTLAVTTGIDTDNMLDATEALIADLTREIDLKRKMDLLRISVWRKRDEPTGNASKANRQRYWSELLAIWTEIGGQETGAHTARFLIAASEAVFDFVRGDADACDKDRALPDQKSVEQWLRRRRATR